MKFKAPYTIRLIIAIIILVLSILGISGVFYPANILDIEMCTLVQRIIFDCSITAILLFIILITITLIFGRIYCSTLCPLGIIQEIFAIFAFKKHNEYSGNYIIKYIISGISLGCLIGGSAIIIKFIDPYTLFGSAISITILGIIAISLILSIVFFKNRFFCTNICPIGALLGYISKFSFNKIYMNNECISCGMCERSCPAGCINANENIIDNEICLKCLKCIDICPKGAIKYGKRPKPEIKFSIKRRELLGSITFLASIGVGLAVGINLVKNISQKVKNVILPAGSESSERMINKCLNCNLCINNCPNQILSKADSNFNTVHIDYEKGKKYCEYDCNKCSAICPSGAIKRISLKEKQTTRIAMAVVNNDCKGCENCKNICPNNAITYENKKAKIDSSKCIGCGKCKAYCQNNAIDIFAVKKQSVI